MLVLTRKTNETIVIDDQITIKVLRIKGGRIRIGIDAPSSVPIRRCELPALDAVGDGAADNDAADKLCCEPSAVQ